MGKNNSTPPPDPRLAKAQADSLAVQDAAIKRMTANSDELAPLQKEQLQLGIKAGQTAYDQSQDDRTWALARRDELQAAQKPLLDESSKFDETTRRGQMMGEANADISSAFNVTRGQQTRALQRMGASPMSGKFQTLTTQQNIGEAIARAEAGRKVSEAAKAEGINLRTNSVNMLSGYPAMASGLSGSGAAFGQSGLGLANQGLAGLNSGYGQAAGVASSMGSNATGMQKVQSDAYQSQQSSNSSSTGSAIGGIATIAVAFI